MANDFPETAVRFAVLRSKHRRRLRRSAWAVGAFLLLGVGGFAVKYAWLSVRYWSQHPRLSRNFTAELNAKVDSVPEAERAWPRYRELLTKIDNRLPSEFYASDEYLRTADQPRARAIAALKRNRELLPRLREIASMPNLGFPLKDAHDPADFAWMQRLLGDNLRPSVVKQPSDNPKLIETLLPYADALRAFARMLTLDAELAMEQNDGQAVTDDIIACLGIADQFLSCPLALDDMLSWSVLGNATGLLRWCVSENSALFSDDQLQRISDRLSVYNRGLPIVPRIDTEYFAVEDMVQRLYSDNGKGDGIFLVHHGIPGKAARIFRKK